MQVGTLSKIELWRDCLLACGQLLEIVPQQRGDLALSTCLPFNRSEIQKFFKAAAFYNVKDQEALSAARLTMFRQFLLRNQALLVANYQTFVDLLKENKDFAALLSLLAATVKNADFAAATTEIPFTTAAFSHFLKQLAAAQPCLKDTTTTHFLADLEAKEIVAVLQQFKSSTKFKTATEIFFFPPDSLAKKLHIQAENIPLDIVYEDEYLLVVNKAQGMVVHPAHGNWEGTLLHALAYHFTECGAELAGAFNNDAALPLATNAEAFADGAAMPLATSVEAPVPFDISTGYFNNSVAVPLVADADTNKLKKTPAEAACLASQPAVLQTNYQINSRRPGIVHRIDKDTSGLLVVAKTAYAESLLQAMVSKHEIQRTYRALAWGQFREQEFTITGALGKDKHHPLKRALDPTGKPAVTHVKLLTQYENFADLQIVLETGRTHQIRVHLSSMQHPLVADPLYCPKTYPTFALQGQCLHAWRLDFKHPVSGGHLSLEAPLPVYYTQLCASTAIINQRRN